MERRPGPGPGGISEADAAWPGRLRRIMRAGLTYWRQPAVIDSAELLLTELVTNALRHGPDHNIDVRVHLRSGRCVIAVTDGSSDRPELRDPGPTEEGGRGLLLVDALACAWGVSSDGTTTWCALPLN
ncbi:hypothetical protein B1H18_09195 [Streptomyces tsukubensis]|uniref:Histidine kinase/HSP90-like ATPase domain-containing protein n=1 Tax=Streptomyces tsukubensis TaxID=83656 RepID=A0A1V4AC69_9ACTN|nr:hypothetical protein B1H18_09195 [Streptomyces tsukubensis]